MNEIQHFNQCRMVINSHAMRNTPEHHEAVSEIHRIIEKHERKGDINSFMKKAQQEIKQ